LIELLSEKRLIQGALIRSREACDAEILQRELGDCHKEIRAARRRRESRISLRRASLTRESFAPALAPMKFGAHMPTAGGVWKALQRGADLGCEVVQIFVKNNMQWFGKPFDPQAIALYANELAAGRLAAVFGHAGYLINLGGPAGEKRDNSLQSLIQEIQFAAELGLPFLVLHPGAHLGAGEEAGIRQIVAGLDEVCRATRALPVRLALENTAGQGTCLGHQIRHLAEIFDRVETPERLGVCLDTAHFFAAGYDIRNRQGWDAALGEVDSRVGLRQVLALHLNDSKTGLGSRVDRHEHIGQGWIGREAFRHIVNDPRFKVVPGCLETPKSPDGHEDRENLAVLRSLVLEDGGSEPAPRPPKCGGKKSGGRTLTRLRQENILARNFNGKPVSCM
jgi:deoxyribonuclease-4